LEAKAIEAEQSTHDRYKTIVEHFTGFLGEAKSKRDLSTLQASDIARFRDRIWQRFDVGCGECRIS
jgi:hypothetical protein